MQVLSCLLQVIRYFTFSEIQEREESILTFSSVEDDITELEKHDITELQKLGELHKTMLLSITDRFKIRRW